MQLKTTYKKLLADTFTPVNVFLKLRDEFPGTLLLESNENRSLENSFSFICCNPYASFEADEKEVRIGFPEENRSHPTAEISVPELFRKFIEEFETEEITGLPFRENGLFGYVSYDAIPLMEDIEFKPRSSSDPLIRFQAFRNLIVFNHYHNEIYLFDHLSQNGDNLEEMTALIHNRRLPLYPFQAAETETSNFTDASFAKAVENGISHCRRGNVFQLVISRNFQRKYTGDDFNLYRALRSINPSPYLFYFDYGNFRVFGSSPEAQLVVEGDEAHIHPIAGTFRRSGSAERDAELAAELAADPKENAEHVMLVDLARNDLSRNSTDVRVARYREVEYYSHVIHLVSKVSARLEPDTNPIQLLADTFPAGTLSGAPKYRAMQLIDENEPTSRGLYGGAIGMIGLDGSVNTAIVIRSFVSRNNTLSYQAGAGVVSASNPISETEEVHNKLAALQNAIQLANTL